MSDLDEYVLWVSLGAALLYLFGVLAALWCLALPFLAMDPLPA